MEKLEEKAREYGFEVGTSAGAVMALAWMWQLFANSSQPPETIQSPTLLAISSFLNSTLLSTTLTGLLLIWLLPYLTTTYEATAFAESKESLEDCIFVVVEIVLLCTPLVVVYTLGISCMVIIPCYYIAFSTCLLRLLQKDEGRRLISTQGSAERFVGLILWFKRNKLSRIVSSISESVVKLLTTDIQVLFSQQSEEYLVEKSAVDIGKNIANQGLVQNEDNTAECDDQEDHCTDVSIDDHEDDEEDSIDDEEDDTEDDTTDDEKTNLRTNDQETWDHMMTTIASKVAEVCEKILCKFTSRIAEEDIKVVLKMEEEIWEQQLEQITSKLAGDYDEKLKKNEDKWWENMTEVGARYAQENKENLKMSEERWEQQLTEITTIIRALLQNLKEVEEKWKQQLVKCAQDYYDKKLKMNDKIKCAQRKAELAARSQQFVNVTNKLARDYENKLKTSEDNWVQSFVQFTDKSALDNKKMVKENEEKWEQVMSMMASKSIWEQEKWEQRLVETRREYQADRQLWEQNLVTITKQYQRDRQEWGNERRHLMAQIEGWNMLEMYDDEVDNVN